MTTQPCPNCPALRAEVARLQLEVAVLERIIADAQNECITMATEAERTLSSNQPRGVWAYAKSKRAAAGRVSERLKG